MVLLQLHFHFSQHFDTFLLYRYRYVVRRMRAEDANTETNSRATSVV